MKLLKRTFLIKSSTARTEADFSLRDVAGSGGRLDVVCRSLIAALTRGDEVRRDAEVYAVLEGPPSPPKTVHVRGSMLTDVPRSEVEVAELLFKLLSGEGVPGCSVVRKGLERLVKDLARGGARLYYLHEKGEPVDELPLPTSGQVCFILGDQAGLSPNNEKFLEELKVERVSLGPKVYLSSHCITVINYELDRRLESVT